MCVGCVLAGDDGQVSGLMGVSCASCQVRWAAGGEWCTSLDTKPSRKLFSFQDASLYSQVCHGRRGKNA